MFCSHCGSTIENGSAFCANCGTAVNGGAAPQQQMGTRLSLEDFLSMSEEYKKEKEKYDAAIRKTGALMLVSIFGVIILGVILFIAFFSMGLFMLAIIGAIALFFPFHAKEQKLKREIEARGGELYKEYLQKNGFPTV